MLAFFLFFSVTNVCSSPPPTRHLPRPAVPTSPFTIAMITTAHPRDLLLALTAIPTMSLPLVRLATVVSFPIRSPSKATTLLSKVATLLRVVIPLRVVIRLRVAILIKVVIRPRVATRPSSRSPSTCSSSKQRTTTPKTAVWPASPRFVSAALLMPFSN